MARSRGVLSRFSEPLFGLISATLLFSSESAFASLGCDEVNAGALNATQNAPGQTVERPDAFAAGDRITIVATVTGNGQVKFVTRNTDRNIYVVGAPGGDDDLYGSWH